MCPTYGHLEMGRFITFLVVSSLDPVLYNVLLPSLEMLRWFCCALQLVSELVWFLTETGQDKRMTGSL